MCRLYRSSTRMTRSSSRAFRQERGLAMAVRIEWGPLEAITNVRNEACKARDFIIQSHDGHVQGQIVVPDDADQFVMGACEIRLLELLKDAIKELER